MAVRRVRNHGKWVSMARVALAAHRRAAFKATREEARDAEADLRRALKAEAAQDAAQAARPATLRQLFDFYAADLEARGKSRDTIVRAAETRSVLARLCPELLDRPVSRIGEADVFAFRTIRAREGRRLVDIVNGETRERW